MFSFRRSRIPVDELASDLAQIALVPLEDLSDQIVALQNEAVRLGVDKTKFTEEMTALGIYAISASVNDARLRREISDEQCRALVDRFMRAVYARLQKNDHLASIGLDGNQSFELILNRGEKYAGSVWGDGTAEQDVPKFFAQFCGVPDSNNLELLGLAMLRAAYGNAHKLLKRTKIVISSDKSS